MKEYGEVLNISFERNEGDDYTHYESRVEVQSFDKAFEATFTVLNAAFGFGPETTLEWIERWVTEYRQQWFEPTVCDSSYQVEEE